MKRRYVLFFLSLLILLLASPAFTENMDPYKDGSKYAYSENTGWSNFRPVYGPGVTVRGGKVTGYVWQENVGWINLSPSAYGGVTYDSNWKLSGYAWGENVGWINFNPTIPGDSNDYGVRIDSNGNFDGYAWGENIGWIHFSSTAPVDYGVSACVVGLDDLHNFAQQWLMDGRGLAADLNYSSHVDFADYSILASDWLDFCPDNWLLK